MISLMHPLNRALSLLTFINDFYSHSGIMKISQAIAAQAALAMGANAVQINYTTVAGYFLQDDNSTNATTFDYVSLAEHQNLLLTDQNRQPPTSG